MNKKETIDYMRESLKGYIKSDVPRGYCDMITYKGKDNYGYIEFVDYHDYSPINFDKGEYMLYALDCHSFHQSLWEGWNKKGFSETIVMKRFEKELNKIIETVRW